MSFLYLLLFSVLISTSKSQTTPPKPTTPPAPAPVPPPSDSCNGVYLSYTYIIGERLPPTPANAYRFESRARILNNGREDLKQWRMFIGFKHDEYLVSASQAILADGTSLPAKVGNGTVFAGFPMTDLKTAIETAGDDTQMGLEIHLVGTQFGVAPPKFPMPENISLANDGFSCPSPNLNGTFMDVCCGVDKNFKANITQEEFLPRQSGDLTIDYDITRSYDSEYWAQVKIANHNSLGRLDYWQLSWDWMRDEFIMNMQGAYPSVLDTTGCFFGPQGAYYKDMDLSTALNCQRRPTIVDLPLTKANDSVLGKIPFCCRNGTILPPSMDPTRSTSAFQIQVKKMPPDLNRTELNPPQNWRINGTLNPDYQCGPPIRVSPSQFPDSSGLPLNKTAIASWQVVCNITQHKGSIPKCCVSFSAYYNDSAIPCNTCACGCPRNPSQTCNADAQALLLPPDSLLVPFDNRTKKATEWYRIKHGSKPQTPLPCSDNCGVSINWHVFSDYRKGWTARMTLFNWGETNFADWFAALEFNKAAPGFEKMYSFDGFALNDTENTIFVQGLSGLNYLVAERDSDKPLKDPRVPGKQQSVISFTKALTPGINVVRGDGFPTKVFFNGEECALPPFIPNSGHRNALGISIWSFLVAVIVLILMQQ